MVHLIKAFMSIVSMRAAVYYVTVRTKQSFDEEYFKSKLVEFPRCAIPNHEHTAERVEILSSIDIHKILS